MLAGSAGKKVTAGEQKREEASPAVIAKPDSGMEE